MGDYDWGQGGKGAVGGALGGAAMGSQIMPGWGTAIGGVAGGLLGGLGGLFGSGQDDAYNRKLQEYYNQVANRQIQEAGPAAQAGYSGFRQNQTDLIKRLEALSSGQGPSLAAQQYQQATDRNMATQQAFANSGRGGAMGALNAANNMGMLGAQAAQGSAMARTDEEMKALNQLGLSVYGARGQDEETNRFNANEQNQTALANLDARLRAMGLNDQARMQILQQMGGQANKPGFGDQLLAGGAGAFMMGATQGKGGMGKTPYGGQWANGQGSLYGMGGPAMSQQASQPWGNIGGGGSNFDYGGFANAMGLGGYFGTNKPDPWA